MNFKQALILAIPVVISPFCIRSHQFGLMTIILIMLLFFVVTNGGNK